MVFDMQLFRNCSFGLRTLDRGEIRQTFRRLSSPLTKAFSGVPLILYRFDGFFFLGFHFPLLDDPGPSADYIEL
jgi:hypothetical protein